MTELKDIMQRAVADAPYDDRRPADVLGAAERDLRRRRAWGTAVVAAALALTLGVVWSAVALWHDREAPVLDNPVDGTPGALAAVALDHVEIQATSVFGGRDSEFYPAGSIWAGMYVKEPGRHKDGIFTLAASPTENELPSCDDADGCAVLETRSGTVDLWWVEDMDLGDQGIVRVTARRGDEMLMASWTGHGVTGDPREADLVVSVDDLVAIVTDPRFGLKTSADAVERGQRLIPE